MIIIAFLTWTLFIGLSNEDNWNCSFVSLQNFLFHHGIIITHPYFFIDYQNTKTVPNMKINIMNQNKKKNYKKKTFIPLLQNKIYNIIHKNKIYSIAPGVWYLTKQSFGWRYTPGQPVHIYWERFRSPGLLHTAHLFSLGTHLIRWSFPMNLEFGVSDGRPLFLRAGVLASWTVVAFSRNSKTSWSLKSWIEMGFSPTGLVSL